MADENGNTIPLFLSTPSARRATLTLILPISFFWIFLSTPSARRATWPHLGCPCVL